MAGTRHGSAVVELPSELDIVVTRAFDAPIELVFDVLTKPSTCADGSLPPCRRELPLRLHDAGGNRVLVSGTYLEIDRPFRIVDTWVFEGWPDAHAVESVDLSDADGVTTVSTKLTFNDKAGRDHMTRFDGHESSYDKLKDYLGELLGPKATIAP